MALIVLLDFITTSRQTIRRLVVLRGSTHRWLDHIILSTIFRGTGVLKGRLQLRWLVGSAAECSLLEVKIGKLLLVFRDRIDLITSLDTIWSISKQVPELTKFTSVIAFVEGSHIVEQTCIWINLLKRSPMNSMFTFFNRIGVILSSILDLRKESPWVWWQWISFAIVSSLIIDLHLIRSLRRHLRLPLVYEP